MLNLAQRTPQPYCLADQTTWVNLPELPPDWSWIRQGQMNNGTFAYWWVAYPSLLDVDEPTYQRTINQKTFPLAPASADEDPDPLPTLEAYDILALRQHERDQRFFDDCLHAGNLTSAERDQLQMDAPLDYRRISARFAPFRGISADYLSESHPAKSSLYLSSSLLESIRFHHGCASIDVYPSCVKIRPKRVTAQQAPVPTTGRGKISGFSPASRRRLMDVLLRIDWAKRTASSPHTNQANTFFITLTYGDEYPTEFTDYKTDLRTLQKRLERHWFKEDAYGLIWKLEFQQRGAPHYHMVLFTYQELPTKELLAWVSSNWAEIITNRMGYDQTYQETVRSVHAGEKSHKGRCVLPAYSDGDDCTRLVNYLSKYMAKPFEFVNHEDESIQLLTGRCWGVWHKQHLPLCQVHHMAFADYIDFKRFLMAVKMRGQEIGSRYLETVNTNRNFTIYGDGLELFLLAHSLSQMGFFYTREDGLPSWATPSMIHSSQKIQSTLGGLYT